MEKFIEKNYKKIILIICILGILVRTVYITVNPIRKNQYDCKIWELYELKDYEEAYKMNEKKIGKAGHMYYIFTIYNTMKLPDGTGGQYYHPPLHHFTSAMWLKLMDILPLNAMQKIESLQVLSLIYSIVILIFIYKILEKTKIKELGKILILILINFYPLFIYMSGFVNNDTLITLFTILNLYYIIKWNEDFNIKNTLMLTFSFGLGMMTKTSMAVMMIPLAYVVILKFIDRIKEKDKKSIKKIIIQAIIFIIIAGALSVWFQIRNLVKYDFEILGIQKPYDHFYSGDASNWERWGFISKDILKNGIRVEDKNIYSSVINSGLYCLYTITSTASYIIKEIAVILSIISFLAVIIIFINKILKKEIKDTIFILLVTFFAWIIGFISFNISLPYSCTMNSRYIGILYIISMIMLGKSMAESKYKIWKYLILVLSIILSIFSVVVVFGKPL